MSDSKLPVGWRKKPLGALVSFQKGRKTDTSKNALNGYARYLGASGLSGKDDGFADMAGAIIAEPSDLLMLWDGERSGLVGYMQQGVVASTVSRLTPTDEIDSAYLYYKLVSLFDWIQARRTGTGVPHVPKDLGKILDITYPKDKIVQRNIAGILRTIDNQIDATQALIDKYTAIKQGMMADLFSRGIDPETKALRPTFEEVPYLYHKTQLGMLPKGWFSLSLQEIASEEKGSTVIGPFGSDLVAADYTREGVPIVFVRDVKVDRFNWKSNTYVSRAKASALKAHSAQPGDVIVTKMGLPPCIAAVYPDSMPNGIITADIIRLRPNDGLVYSDWVAIAINSNEMRKQVEAITAGVTRPKVTLKDFRQLTGRFPPKKEQELILDRLEPIKSLIESEEAAVIKLKLQKQGLMQDLLTGKVPVLV